MKKLVFILLIPFISFAQDDIVILENDKLKVSYSYKKIKENKNTDSYSVTIKVENLTGMPLYYLEKQKLSNYSSEYSDIGYINYLVENVKSSVVGLLNKAINPSIDGKKTSFGFKRTINIEGLSNFYSIYSINTGITTKRLSNQRMDKGFEPSLTANFTSNILVSNISEIRE